MENRLRELRLERSLRQKDVAEKLGISPQSLGYYENAINKPDPDTLVKLADFFEVSIDYLLGREDEFGSIRLFKDALSVDEKELLQSFRDLNDEGKNIALTTIKLWNYVPEYSSQNKNRK